MHASPPEKTPILASSGPLRRLVLMLGIRKEFHDLDLRARVVLGQLPMSVLSLATLVLGLTLYPELLANPLFAAGQILQAVLLAACILIPWDRLPSLSYWSIPILDFAVVGFLREGAGESLSAIGVLSVLPVIWLTVSGRAPALAGLIIFLAPLLMLWVPVFIADRSIRAGDLLAPVMLPLVLLGIWATLHSVLQSLKVQHAQLLAKDEALSHALEESRRNETLLDGIAEAIDVGIVAVDEDGHDVLRNRKQRAIHQLATPPDIPDPNESQLEVYSDDGATSLPAEERPVRRAVNGESFSELVVRLGRGRGQRAFSVSARQIRTRAGAPAGRVIAFNDVTELQEALAAKDEFVSSVSHELRTPLTSILGYLELCLDDEERLPPDTAARLHIIERNTERLLVLVGDLLATAAGTMKIQRQATALAELIDNCVASARP
ncbi:histidine kinase dimerization/phospho-acceptor domain-containing protein [Crystallibacter crystallopoietes]|uniref:histidine kinase dimerization/phospho-acceptor domain-containing protein n=1 Tax=Crystallibacter crystallopoietes TaxID=37928 RepID=UPI0002D7181D